MPRKTYTPVDIEVAQPPEFPKYPSPEAAFRSRADIDEGIGGRQGITTEAENTKTSRGTVLAPRSSFRDEVAPDENPDWHESWERREQSDGWQRGQDEKDYC